MEQDEILSRSEFSEKVEAHAQKEHINLVPAIIELCEAYDIDIIHIPRMITPNLKEKIAVSENMHGDVYGKTFTLPV